MAEMVFVANYLPISMTLHTGLGNAIVLEPGFQGDIPGNFAYLKRTQQKLAGLVVKKSKKEYDAEAMGGEAIVEMDITNHKKIPARLALGTGASIELNPGETKRAYGKPGKVKKVHGMSVVVVDAEVPVEKLMEIQGLDKSLQTPASAEEVKELGKRTIAEKVNLPPDEATFRFMVDTDELKLYDLRGAIAVLGLGVKSRSKKDLADALAEALYQKK